MTTIYTDASIRPDIDTDDTIVVLNAPGMANQNLIGHVRTVTGIEYGGAYGENSGDDRYEAWKVYYEADGGRFYCTMWEKVPAAAAERISTLNAKIAAVEYRSETLSRELSIWKQHYQSDMQHWELVLREEKDSNNWCDDGANRVIAALNSGFNGPYSIEPYLNLVEVEVQVTGTVHATVTVHVKEGDDPDDTDNWVDEDGDEIDSDEAITSALMYEVRNNGFESRLAPLISL